jgi:hypothetical protein
VLGRIVGIDHGDGDVALLVDFGIESDDCMVADVASVPLLGRHREVISDNDHDSMFLDQLAERSGAIRSVLRSIELPG